MLGFLCVTLLNVIRLRIFKSNDRNTNDFMLGVMPIQACTDVQGSYESHGDTCGCVSEASPNSVDVCTLTVCFHTVPQFVNGI
jgi:hypothetical protein